MAVTPFVTGLKLISTIGLGLASSFALTLGAYTLPTIYRVADAPKRAADLVGGGVLELVRLSAYVVTASGVLQIAAYVLSPAYARHPYLLYSAIGSLAVTGYTQAILVPLLQRLHTSGDLEKGDKLNGERFSRDFDTLLPRTTMCGAATAVSFVIATIGNFGDLY